MKANYVEVQNILKNLHFPVTNHELIQQAINCGASYNMVQDLLNISDRKYTSSDNVIEELGGK